MNIKLKTISIKLNLILLVTVLSVLSSYGFYTYNQYSTNIKEELEENINRVNKRLNLILPRIIWNLQNDLAKEIIETEALDESIDAIIINDIDNTLIASVVNDKNINYKYHKSKKVLKLKFENEVIADVLIYNNYNKIKEAKIYVLKSLIIKIIVIFIILQILFSLFINKFIISNIIKLQEGISLFSKNKDFNKDIIIGTDDELNMLAEEFNSMKNNLKDSWEQLNELNQNLKPRYSKATI